VESGAGTFINDTLAEEKAAELRAAAPTELPGAPPAAPDGEETTR
jgi:hypothetical protein